MLYRVQQKKYPIKAMQNLALYVAYYHFESAFNIILCMRDTVVLK